MSGRRWLLVIVALALIASGIGLQWWNRRQAASPAVVAAAPPAPAPAASAPAAPEAAPQSYPVDVPLDASPLKAAEIPAALTSLLGRHAVLTFLQTAEFPRRFVATVDNLGRSHAPALLWPVNPMAGRFQVVDRPGGAVVGLDNSLRYAAFVRMTESVDIAQAAVLYRRIYPQLQRTYEELGFPKRQFNDRFVQVIDQLLATPDAVPQQPVRLTDVKGPIESTHPWLRYEYAEPALQSLTAGQKILLRVGPVNQRRLKERLKLVRQELTRPTQPAR